MQSSTTSNSTNAQALSGNPCPFLRALAENGTISGTHEPLGHIGGVVADALTPPAKQGSTRVATALIALIGNGLGPFQLLQNLSGGLRPNKLRGGPLDKRGAGSGVLDQHGEVNLAEIDRFNEFAIDYTDAESGQIERGLGSAQLQTMMNANFERAAGRRRNIDRKLMEGEWPVLLRVMGKASSAGTYLSVAEIRTLVVERKLPERVLKRVGKA